MATPPRGIATGSAAAGGAVRWGDLVAGAAAVFAGVAVFVLTAGFPEMPDGHPGPALFPNLVAALLMLFGAALGWQALRAPARAVLARAADMAARPAADATAKPTADAAVKPAEKPAADPAEPPPGPAPAAAGGPATTAPLAAGVASAWVNALLVIGAVVAYVLLVERLGFPLTIGLLNAGLMRRFGVSWVVALPVAAAVGAGVYVLFARVLLVPLPGGPLG